ncbi:MAG: DUF3368 domain-containing protein [Thermodesulfobacteriota bacterium]
MHEETVVGDSSPLIALAIIDQLALLPQLYARVVVPQEVWEEVTVRGAGLPGALELRQLSWLKVEYPPVDLLLPLTVLVGRGEAQAIALALARPGSTALLDDALARRVAERFGVKRIGTLGLLRRAKQRGLIEAIKPFVQQLQANGIFIRQSLVEAVLQDVGEWP